MLHFQLFCLIFIKVIGLVLAENGDESGVGLFRMEGKVTPPDAVSDDWYAASNVLVNGGEHLGFVRSDGSFVVNNMPSGSYVVEIANSEYSFEPARVEINSKGKIRARKLNWIQSTQVLQVPYPLKFKMKAKLRYFQPREQWRVTDFLFSPMEMQQSLQSPNFDMPDLAEKFTSWFEGGKKQPSTKAVKAGKKRN